MRITAVSATDPGAKKTNEDFHLTDPELGLFIVCDGVGSAAQVAAETIQSFISKSDKPSAALMAQAIQEANRALLAQSQKDISPRSFFTTVEAIWISGSRAFLAHVGDSRSYLIRSGKTHSLTEDHTFYMEMVKEGYWDPEEAKKSPFQGDLTRVLGSRPIVKVDCLQVDLEAGDFLVLSSDGLTDSVSIQDFAASPKPQDLIIAAKKKGAKDNITVIVIGVEAEKKAIVLPATVTQKINMIRETPLFRYLSYKQAIQVMSLVSVRSFDSKALIAKEGSESDEMYIILSGSAEIAKSTHIVARRTQGDLLGEMGIFDDAPRSASIIATEPTTLMVITKKDLLRLLQQDAELALKLQWGAIQGLIHKLRSVTEDLAFAKEGQKLHSPTTAPRR